MQRKVSLHACRSVILAIDASAGRRLTQAGIADLAGLSRLTVNTALAALTKENVIRGSHLDGYRINKPAAVEMGYLYAPD